MEYFKFHIDEDNTKRLYCVYRDLSKGKSANKIVRSYPLETIGEEEPRLLEMVEGDITDVYYEEFNNEVRASEVKWFLGQIDPVDEESIAWIRQFVKCACVNEDFDHLTKPPSLDQQVEDFIREFFDNDEVDEPAEQKDFLAEFFAELEEDSK